MRYEGGNRGGMMDLWRSAELMRIERECIKRSDSCDRDCAKCNLVQDPKELCNAYTLVTAILETIIRWDGGSL